MKASIVTDMLPPYRLSFFNHLANLCDLTILVDCKIQRGRNWKFVDQDLKFKLIVLDGPAVSLKRSRSDVRYAECRQFHFSPGVLAALYRIKPDVVVTAELGFRTLWATLYSGLFKGKLILWTEGTLHTEGKAGFFKRHLRPLLIRHMDGFWTNGPESTDLVTSYGGSRLLATESMTGIDTDWWLEQAQRWRPKRVEIRAELGITGLTIIVNGSLSPRKGIRQLIAALDRWCPKEPMTLVFVGGGELEQEVRRWADGQLNYKVILTGFLDPPDMPRYFAVADWAVLPTLDDNWPLATLEALCAGLPQLFSVYNGATSDLCVDGVTGYAFDPLDLNSFVEGLRQMEAEGERQVPHEIVKRFAVHYSPLAQATRAIQSFRSLVAMQIMQ